MASLQAWNVNLTGCVDRALSPVTRAKPYLAALGAVYLSFKTGQAAYCLGRGLVSYFLTQPLQLAIDLRKIGEWAGNAKIRFVGYYLNILSNSILS